jgi:hypothetical protein
MNNCYAITTLRGSKVILDSEHQHQEFIEPLYLEGTITSLVGKSNYKECDKCYIVKNILPKKKKKKKTWEIKKHI